MAMGSADTPTLTGQESTLGMRIDIGYIFKLAGGLIWQFPGPPRSKQTSITLLSSIESEYICQGLAAQEAIWIQPFIYFKSLSLITFPSPSSSGYDELSWIQSFYLILNSRSCNLRPRLITVRSPGTTHRQTNAKTQTKEPPRL